MRRLSLALFVLALISIAAASSRAQVATGTPPFGSFSGGPDVMNLGNLNSHLTIPVLHKPGRGTNFSYDLPYDSSVWYPVGSSGNQAWWPVGNWGWRGQTEVATGYVSYLTSIGQCFFKYQLVNVNLYSNFVYHDSFGVAHSFTMPLIGPSCYHGASPSAAATTTDGSGYQISATDSPSATIASSNGTVFNPPLQSGSGAGNYTDRNGNVISADGSGHFNDTLSATVLTVAGSGTSSSPTTFTYTAPSGVSASYTMSYVAYTVATNFAVSGISEYGAQAVNLADKITLPDNTFYQFSYEQTPNTPSSGACTPKPGTYQNFCVTARIVKITLPAGGSISYNYTGGAGTNNTGIWKDGSAATLTRTTPDGQWVYAQTKGTGAASATVITDPQNNVTVLQFQGIYETERQTYQGSTSGALLSTIDTCYNGAVIPCSGTAIVLPIGSRTVQSTIPSAASTNLVAKTATTYNSVGVPTEIDTYAFGSGSAPSSPTRKTSINYAPLGDITAFPKQVSVYNGSGGLLSQTTYNYDEPNTLSSAPSGTPQLSSITGSRGNLTSVQRCTVLASCSTSFVTSSMTYDTAGQLLTAKDPAGNQTTYSYADNFLDDDGSNPPSKAHSLTYPTDAYVTSITPPLNGAITMKYYFYNGQLAQTADQNSRISFNHFDSDQPPDPAHGIIRRSQLLT